MFRSQPHHVTAARIAAAVCLAVTLAISSGAVAGAATSDRAPISTQARTPATTTIHLAARTTTDLAIYARRGGAAPRVTLPATTEFGTARVVLVTKRKGAWLEILLPERPNGSRGWVRTRDVELRSVHDEVEVDLATHRLTWLRDGEIVLETAIAVGAAGTPTPTGHFFVTDLLDTPDGGGYGPYAIGLSAHSDTLSEFGGGDGQIGLHGTSDPSSIGQSVSHGCVRIPNEIVAQMATNLALGTPVTIR